MAEEIEVYRDMALQGPAEQRVALRAALIQAATPPWRVDLKRSEEVRRNAVSTEDVILFRRDAADQLPAVGLTLWERDGGYYVPNIVPLEFGKLTFGQYNAALADFIERVAAPVVPRFGFTLQSTEATQSLEDWITADAATKLRRFSAAANKSTGASHPMDERRWFDFIVAVHRDGKRLDPDRLARWLHEAEAWDEESAHKLAGDYENGLALLAYYDEH